MPAPSRVCHFLHIPTEMRAHVYRYLLLPHTKCFLRYLNNAEEDSRPISPPGLFSGSDFYSDSNAESDEPTLAEEDDDKSEYSAFRLEPRSLEILRTNRQIYAEAIGLFYSELQIMVQPGDMICVASVNEIAPPSRKVWKHDPLHGIGTRAENGQYIYDTPQLDGFLEPHIFARFPQIQLDLDFDFEGLLEEIDDDTFPKVTFHIDKDLSIRGADIDAMKMYLQQTNLFTNFALVLSRSSHIRSLGMVLCVTVAVDYPNKKDFREPYDPANEEEDMRVEEVFENVAGKRAAEIFLESGALEPFKQLANVRSFKVEVEDMERGFGYAEPQGVAGEIARELKQVVEERYLLSQNGFATG